MQIRCLLKSLVFLVGILYLPSKCGAGEGELPPPPPELKELVDRGGVTFDFYDPEQKKLQRPGLTRFLLNCNWSFKVLPESRMQAGRVRLTIKPYDVQLTTQIKHTVSLPEHAVDDAFWKKSLVLHEFDHVTISADPRPRRLMHHLALKLRSIERTLERGEKPTEALCNDIVNKELNARRQAITDLMNRNHALLDEQSQHGGVPLPKRAEFFQELYTRANLKAMEFPYLADVLDLVQTKEYHQPETSRPRK